MRRPAMTREQRQHAKEQRALLALRRAAVRYSIIGDAISASTTNEHRSAFREARTDLDAACDKYTEAIGMRSQRKLVGSAIVKLRSVP